MTSTTEQIIGELIRKWAEAVSSGDMTTVLRQHAKDIVMFDVPPPEQGLRGIKSYEETWPPFFDFQLHGAVFEIVELDVTAGETVAYAWALLQCGTPDDLTVDGESRMLRLTIGLRKEEDKWIVAHEHHSFTLRD